MSRRVLVYGPAYLDRVLRVDRPIVEPASGPPLDLSVDGVSTPDGAPGLRLVDPSGFVVDLGLPPDWPGPEGRIDLNRTIQSLEGAGAAAGGPRVLRATSWRDDLGGMGAGYAASLGGVLSCALGSESDPVGRQIVDRLNRAGILHRVVRIDGRAADWTLLVTSGAHGDKLAIGFRGCHAAVPVDRLTPRFGEPADALVVAGLPNRFASPILTNSAARIRFFAPSIRNMLDEHDRVSSFARSIDVLCCNRLEWESLGDREEVAWRVSILAVTDGPAGAVVRYTGPNGDSGRLAVPAFPRSAPPVDTNRAGEAFGSSLLATLLDHDWNPAPGTIAAELIGTAARQASAAAGLVLDRADFGFPEPTEIDAVIAAGRIDRRDRD